MTKHLERSIESILKKIPVVTKQQLIAYLKIQMSCKEKVILEALTECAHSGVVLIAFNELITTREAYDVVRTADLPYKFGVIQRLRGNLSVTAETQDFIDCFWIILNLLPASSDFILTSYTPFRMLYLDRENNRLVQIARFRRGFELTDINFLRALPTPAREDRAHIRRIALLDDEQATELLGGFGFTDFCLLDDHQPGHISVIKKVGLNEAWEGGQFYG